MILFELKSVKNFGILLRKTLSSFEYLFIKKNSNSLNFFDDHPNSIKLKFLLNFKK